VSGFVASYPIWQNVHWASGSGDPNAAAQYDVDLDGLPNLLEFAFGSNPRGANVDPCVIDVVEVAGVKYLRLSVTKNPAALDLDYAVEAADSLAAPAGWSSSGLVIEVNTPSLLRVRDNVPLSTNTSRFMHVKVSLP
jgi:hypothetical protein